MKYFSDREGPDSSRDKEEVTDAAVRGFGALIRSRASIDAFGLSFPVRCSRCSRRQIVRCDEQDFWDALGAVVPDLDGWPKSRLSGAPHADMPSNPLQVLDAIEFCHAHVAKSREVEVPARPSPFADVLLQSTSRLFGEPREHYHLRFDRTAGQDEFREQVEDIFRRNGLAYTLTPSGRVERILPTELDESIRRSEFTTGDDDLDELLTTARSKFLDPNAEVRLEALKSLWDAWERLKTMGAGSGKRLQTKAVLDAAAGSHSPILREALEKEARELTDLGNELQIRHFEIGKEKLATSEHVDYLFQRMFSLIWMILRTQKMVGVET